MLTRRGADECQANIGPSVGQFTLAAFASVDSRRGNADETEEPPGLTGSFIVDTLKAAQWRASLSYSE